MATSAGSGRRLREDVGRRGGGEQLRQRALAACRLARHEDRADRGGAGHDLLRHRAVIEALERVRYDIGHRARSAQEMRDFGVPVRAQRGDGNGADACERKVRVDEFGNVRKLDHHAIQRADPGVEQTAREAIDRFPERVVADSLVGTHERDLLRRASYRPRQQVGQRDALPMAQIAVPLCDVRGPGRASLEHEVILLKIALARSRRRRASRRIGTRVECRTSSARRRRHSTSSNI